MVYLTFFGLLFIKTQKITRARTILQSNSTSFSSDNFFLRTDNKKVMAKGEGGAGDPAQFFRK